MWGVASGMVLAVIGAAGPTSAFEAGPGWAGRRIEVPDVVQGDVVVTNDGVMLVGQGAFGPGTQRIVRREPSGATTTIATGFGSLGGFALADDGTLYAVDNCFDGDFGCDGATTGDTVYAIPDALGRTDAIAAADAELLPAGSIPAAFDVLVSPVLGLLVSDAAGPGAGRIVRVADGSQTQLLGGFDFTAGIALQGDRLLVGNSDEFFVGSVLRFESGAEPGSTLVGGLSGAFDVEASASTVFVSGGFTEDFASSTVVAIDDVGAPSTVASGFAFTGGLGWEPLRRQLYALDFGARDVSVLCEDADGDDVCDAACSAATPARTRVAVTLASDGTAPLLRLSARLRMARGERPDPSATGVAVTLTDADGTLLADWRVPGGPEWQRKGRRWIWPGDAGAPVRSLMVRRRGRRLVVEAEGLVGRLPTGAFRTSAAVMGPGGGCGVSAFDAIAAASR